MTFNGLNVMFKPLLPPGKVMLYASASGRRKGMKPLKTLKLVLKHKQTTAFP
jgi:hypothetical protein